MAELSEEGKDELALALILWRDFKAQGRFDVGVVQQMFEMAKHLGIEKNLEKMLPQVPPLKIVARH